MDARQLVGGQSKGKRKGKWGWLLSYSSLSLRESLCLEGMNPNQVDEGVRQRNTEGSPPSLGKPN